MIETDVSAGPRAVSSRRRIKYRHSSWRTHQFQVCGGGGEVLCRASAVRMADSLLVSLGGPGAAALGELALAMPGPPAIATALLSVSGDSVAASMARRLSAVLSRPVYVCCGATFDRFTLPLVERGLAAEIRTHPDYF